MNTVAITGWKQRQSHDTLQVALDRNQGGSVGSCAQDPVGNHNPVHSCLYEARFHTLGWRKLRPTALANTGCNRNALVRFAHDLIPPVHRGGKYSRCKHGRRKTRHMVRARVVVFSVMLRGGVVCSHG